MDLIKLAYTLKDKGFERKEYKGQKEIFYTLEITDIKEIEKYALKFYGYDFEDLEFSNVSLVVELQEDFSTPQWCFTGGLDKFCEFDSLQEFYEFIKEI